MTDAGRHRSELIEELVSALLRLAEYAHTHSMLEVLQRTVDEAERLTGSRIGFFHLVEEQGLTLSLQAWSTNTLATMCFASGEQRHYPVEQAGVWVDCLRQRAPVIHNDYASLQHRRGMPEGHAPVARELLVPVARGGTIVAILGIGNKPTAYDAQDIEVVDRLANLAWDIALHQRATEALAQRERDLAKAQAVAHVGSWTLDLRANKLSWSDEVFRIFGREPRQFEETFEAFLENVHPEDREAVSAGYARAIREHTGYEVVHRVLRPDGEVRVVRERSEEIVDETGAVVQSIGTVLDITELARAEEQLRRLNAELEQRVWERTAELERINAEKNELLGMAVHDLRNPLAVIQGYARLLEEGLLGPLRSEQTDVLGRIGASSRFMLKLIDDLLAVSRIDAGRLELRCAAEDLRALLGEIVAASQVLATPKRISVVLLAGEPLPPLRVDRVRVEQVLSNLVGNAIKFSPGGTRIEISARREGGAVVICVKDEGRGIDPETMSRLFVAFGTGSGPGTAGERSTGLGLAIARRMVEAHGGRIWADSAPGAGARFYVALPVGLSEAPAPSADPLAAEQ